MKKLLLAIMATSITATPVLAAKSAGSVKPAASVRAGSTVDKKNKLSQGGTIAVALLGVAAIGGFFAVAFDERDAAASP